MRFPAIGLLFGLIFLSGCDLVTGPPVPFPDVPSKPLPEPEPPSPAPPAPEPPAPPSTSSSLTGLGNPFADVYPASVLKGKASVQDLAVVDGRVYVAHGGTSSHYLLRPIYYDIGAERWKTDDASIHQEGVSKLQLGPSGRLYMTALDPQGIPAVLMIRRERNGTWTERVADSKEDHSRHTYEWVNPRTGKTLVFVHNGAPYFPNVSISYDGGGSFRSYGYESSPEGRRVSWYHFFPFDGELYAATVGDPYLMRYTGDKDRPFEVVASDYSDVYPGSRSQVQAAAEVGGHIVIATREFYGGSELKRSRMRDLGVPGRARDLVRVGDTVYMLATDGDDYSVLYETRDGATSQEVATFDRKFTTVEYADGAFYLGESGTSEHSLWRYVRGR